MRKVANSCVQIKGTAFGNFSGEQVISIRFGFCKLLLAPLISNCWVGGPKVFTEHLNVKSEAACLNLNLSENGLEPDIFWLWARISFLVVWEF